MGVSLENGQLDMDGFGVAVQLLLERKYSDVCGGFRTAAVDGHAQMDARCQPHSGHKHNGHLFSAHTGGGEVCGVDGFGLRYAGSHLAECAQNSRCNGHLPGDYARVQKDSPFEKDVLKKQEPQ